MISVQLNVSATPRALKHAFFIVLCNAVYVIAQNNWWWHKGSVSLTTADKFSLLNLSYIMAPQVGWTHTLSVEAHPRPLAQPVGEPGQVAVAVQVVRMETAKWEKRSLKQENGKRFFQNLKISFVIHSFNS